MTMLCNNLWCEMRLSYLCTCFAVNQQIVSCSFDETARLHGLRSGRTLREFKGHSVSHNIAQLLIVSACTLLNGGCRNSRRL